MTCKSATFELATPPTTHTLHPIHVSISSSCASSSDSLSSLSPHVSTVRRDINPASPNLLDLTNNSPLLLSHSARHLTIHHVDQQHPSDPCRRRPQGGHAQYVSYYSVHPLSFLTSTPHSDPNVSKEAKEHSRQVVEEMEGSADVEEVRQGYNDENDKHETRVNAGYKATLKSTFLLFIQ
jgi:hypothetical protein